MAAGLLALGCIPALHAPAAVAQGRAFTASAGYRVFGVRQGDVLNVRSLPDASAPVVVSLPPGTTGIQRSGRSIQNVDTTWVEIRHNGMSGWVAARYLAPDSSPPAVAPPASAALGGPAWKPEVKPEPSDGAQAAVPVAASRVALVIGNGRYPIDSSLSQLLQPPNDGRDLAAALKARGYDVIALIDADLVELRRGLLDFKTRSASAEIGLVYFGGHALQMNGETYLLPITSRIKKADDLRRHALPLSEVVGGFGQGTPRQAFLVVDASRGNRLHDRLAEVARKAGTPDLAPAKGLANPLPRPGMTVIYAAEPGQIALDGNGRNSVLAQPLLAGLGANDPNMATIVGGLRDAVARATGNRQVPWFEETAPDVRLPTAKVTPSRQRPGGSPSLSR